MRGLTILVGGGASAAGWRTALKLALAQAAVGGPVRLFLDGAAVALIAAPGDEAALLAETLAAAVPVTLCQSELAAHGLRADRLDPRLGFGGLIGLLAGLGDDRLVTF